MKTTIRRSVFETNSSSVHTLTLRNVPNDTPIKQLFDELPKTVKQYLKDNGIMFGIYDIYECRESGLDKDIIDFMEKSNTLYRNIVGTDNLGFILKSIKSFINVFNEVNIKCEIDEESAEDAWSYGCSEFIYEITTPLDIAILLFTSDSGFNCIDDCRYNPKESPNSEKYRYYNEHD